MGRHVDDVVARAAPELHADVDAVHAAARRPDPGRGVLRRHAVEHEVRARSSTRTSARPRTSTTVVTTSYLSSIALWKTPGRLRQRQHRLHGLQRVVREVVGDPRARRAARLTSAGRRAAPPRPASAMATTPDRAPASIRRRASSFLFRHPKTRRRPDARPRRCTWMVVDLPRLAPVAVGERRSGASTRSRAQWSATGWRNFDTVFSENWHTAFLRTTYYLITLHTVVMAAFVTIADIVLRLPARVLRGPDGDAARANGAS